MEENKKWTDEDIIECLAQEGSNANAAINILKDQWREYYERQLNRIHPVNEDIEYIVNDVIINIRDLIIRGNFNLEGASLKTYFTRSLMHGWQKYRIKVIKLEEKKKKFQKDVQNLAQLYNISENKVNNILDDLLELIDEKCKELLLLVQQKVKLADIAILFNQSEGHIKNKKRKCIDKMKAKIPDYEY